MAGEGWGVCRHAACCCSSSAVGRGGLSHAAALLQDAMLPLKVSASKVRVSCEGRRARRGCTRRSQPAHCCSNEQAKEACPVRHCVEEPYVLILWWEAFFARSLHFESLARMCTVPYAELLVYQRGEAASLLEGRVGSKRVHPGGKKRVWRGRGPLHFLLPWAD